MAKKNLYITVLAYKDDNGFYGAAGAGRQISCSHQNEGKWYINNKGELTGLPTTTVPLSRPGNQYQHGANYVDYGTTNKDANRFPDSDYKAVYKIKDTMTGITTYVDTTDWDSKIIACNPVPYPSICSAPTSLSAGTPAATTATITFTEGVNATGYEWVNQVTPGTQPVIAGTFASSSPILLTGLTPAHAYRFWIRTICAAMYKSSWVSVNFTTA